MLNPYPETTTVAVNMNDRKGRRLFMVVNNDQRCVVAMWLESHAKATADVTLENTRLYELLRPGLRLE